MTATDIGLLLEIPVVADLMIVGLRVAGELDLHGVTS